jgi:hypothetical protein
MHEIDRALARFACESPPRRGRDRILGKDGQTHGKGVSATTIAVFAVEI